MRSPVAAFARHRLHLLLAAGVAVAYANAFEGAFQFDDVSILSDSRLENLAGYLAHLGGMIRPAVKLTFLADRALWGAHPAGYHALNLLLHLGSGTALYAIASDLGGTAPARRWAGTVAFWAALLFLVHPVGTETVTYISGRATGQMACCYLVGLWLYLRATSGPFAARRRSYLAALACFLAALLSKETAITFPAALVLVDAVARGKTGRDLRDAVLRAHLPFWGVLLLFLAAASFQPRYVDLLDTSLRIRAISANVLTQIDVVAYALSLFVLPGRISIAHDIPLASLSTWSTPAALALLLGLLGSAILLTRRNPLAAFGLFWFFLQLLPTNSVLPRYELLSDRNLYLPGAGLALAAASVWAASLAWVDGHTHAGRWSRLTVAAAMRMAPVALVAWLVLATMARNAVYADPVAFWSDAVGKAPATALVHVNLGHACYVAGDLDRAIAECRIALALDRGNPYAQAILQAAWRRKGGTVAPGGEPGER